MKKKPAYAPQIDQETLNQKIQEYKLIQLPNQKQALCRFWLKGICIFEDQDCKFAHGINDLVFIPYNQEIDEETSTKQRSFWDEVYFPNFDCSLKIQQNLIKQGLLDKIYTRQELKGNKKLKTYIREQLLKQQILLFWDIFYQNYNNDYLFFHPQFIEKEFSKVGLVNLGAKIRVNFIFSAIQQLSDKFIIQEAKITIPPHKKNLQQVFKVFEKNNYQKIVQNFENKLINILTKIRENLLQNSQKSEKNENLPENILINENMIKKQLFLTQLPLDPNLNTILSIKNLSLKNYLAQIFQPLKTHFIQKNLLFSETDKIFFFYDEMPTSIQQEIQLILENNQKKFQNHIYSQNQKLVLLNYNLLENQINQKFEKLIKPWGSKQNFSQYLNFYLHQKFQQNNQSQINLLFPHQISSFFLSLDLNSLFEGQNSNKNNKQNQFFSQIEQIENFSSCQCGKKPQNIQINQILDKIKVYKETEYEKTSYYEKKRAIIVNNEETFEFAALTLSKHTTISIDLEGVLKDGFQIDLVQIGIITEKTQNQTFIFDYFEVEQLKKNQSLTLKFDQLLTSILENPKTVKIFHDCRRDSLALHNYLNCCPKNIFDTSATQLFITQLQNYLQILQKNTKNQKNSQNSQNLQDFSDFSNSENFLQNFQNFQLFQTEVQKSLKQAISKSPGLNEIFQNYNYKQNELKQEMHSKFSNFQREQFTQRPINEDFLEYAILDVENLIFIYRQMLNKLKSLISNFKQILLNEEEQIQELNYQFQNQKTSENRKEKEMEYQQLYQNSDLVVQTISGFLSASYMQTSQQKVSKK